MFMPPPYIYLLSYAVLGCSVSWPELLHATSLHGGTIRSWSAIEDRETCTISTNVGSLGNFEASGQAQEALLGVQPHLIYYQQSGYDPYHPPLNSSKCCGYHLITTWFVHLNICPADICLSINSCQYAMSRASSKGINSLPGMGIQDDFRSISLGQLSRDCARSRVVQM